MLCARSLEPDKPEMTPTRRLQKPRNGILEILRNIKSGWTMPKVSSLMQHGHLKKLKIMLKNNNQELNKHKNHLKKLKKQWKKLKKNMKQHKLLKRMIIAKQMKKQQQRLNKIINGLKQHLKKLKSTLNGQKNGLLGMKKKLKKLKKILNSQKKK